MAWWQPARPLLVALIAAGACSNAGGQQAGDDPVGNLLSMLGGLGGGGDGPEPEPVCEPGKEAVPLLDQHEKLSANGCGPQGLQIQEPYGLYQCCNGHDVCFSICGTSHSFCESEFRSCMKQVCKKPRAGSKKECRNQAKTFSSLTMSFGLAFHQTSQKEACECLPKGEAVGRRHQEYLLAFYERYNTSAAFEATVAETLTQWKGREAELYFELVQRHGSKFVRFDNIAGEFFNSEL